MDDLLRFALLGIGVGALYGLTAQGLVLVFLSARVLNFSQGAIALLAAYLYFLGVKAGLPLILAAIAAVLGAAIAGALIELLVMRRLRDSSAVTRLVATIAVLTVIQSAAALLYGDATQFVPNLLPTAPLRFGGSLIIGTDRVIILGVAVAITAALTVLIRRTRLGLATLGTAENPVAIEVLGWSARRISLVSWMVGAGLAGVAGVLIAPINGVSVSGMGQIVYSALAAALIGGFRSFPMAMIGGLVLGVAQAEAVQIRGDVGWSTAIPFIVIVIVVLIRGDVIRGRAASRPRLPSVGTGRVGLVGLSISGIVLVGAALLLDGGALSAFTASLIIAVLGLSVVVATGYAGELSLATYAIAGVGALGGAQVAAILHLPFLLCLIVAIMAGLATGLLVGLLSARVSGDIVAIVSVGLALALQALVLENPAFTGGIAGVAVPSASIFGISIDPIRNGRAFAVVCIVVLVIAGTAVANVRRGAAGRRLLAVRSGPRAAASLGISVPGARLYALALSGAVAGLAGGLFAFSSPAAIFDGFTVDASIALLGAVVLGGVGYLAAGSVAGFAITGGFIYFLLALSGLQRFLPLALGLALLVNLVLVPDGVMPANARMLRRAMALVGRRPLSTPVAPPLGRPRTPRTRYSGDRPLEVRGLSVSFGGVRALDDVSISIQPGQVEGLIGPNGAGKTTLIDTVTGITRGYVGRVALGGRPLDRLSPAARARQGLGRTIQDLELFEELTVRENLVIGSDTRAKRSYLSDLVRPGPALLSVEALEVIERFGLAESLELRPSELPFGRRKLVAIARAVAAEPAVLLMDEPAAGLSAAERVELGDLIRRLAEEKGLAILLVEHDVDLVMRICDHITVLEFGRVIAQGSPEEVRSHDDVRRAFLGKEPAA